MSFNDIHVFANFVLSILLLFISFRTYKNYKKSKTFCDEAKAARDEYISAKTEYNVARREFAEFLGDNYESLCEDCRPLFECENVNMGRSVNE